MAVGSLRPSSRPSSGDNGNTLLRRVGLSVLGSNLELEQKVKQEASDAERSLIELRQRTALQAAQCRGQLDVLSKEARAEEERRLISDRVARELEAFRREMHKKEAQEEEHIRQMYRAILQPQPISEAFSVRTVGGATDYHIDGSRMYPPIISSAVNLDDNSLDDSTQEWQKRFSMEEIPPTFGSVDFDSTENWLKQDEYRRSSQPSYRIPRVISQSPHRSQTASPREGSDEPSEAQNLLRVNLARLERLERLGL